ncbi:unnamed protein product [Angiostrongylus costaricensis]|uniref:MAM domain-containing protein n=1 Tax=Angiostrongylus costaricensis TaxID=334426 RepID=A0A0R3PHE1_ANGCS|nr:unnamed protein product [Angiostrongylus costaricensis]
MFRNSTIFPVPNRLKQRRKYEKLGSYLLAYARGAAPSDEAQFASCSIGCSASDITVRVRYVFFTTSLSLHWTSENVLLQVCLRESFPNAGVVYNPLLNCQEFPASDGLTATELVLPKTSLVDIVFVASNFIGEIGDLAILNDIEVSYDRNGPECEESSDEQLQSNVAETQLISKLKKLKSEATKTERLPIRDDKTGHGDNNNDAAVHENKFEAAYKAQGVVEKHVKEMRTRLSTEVSSAKSAIERFGEEGFKGGNAAFDSAKSEGINRNVEEAVIKSTKTSTGQNVAKGTKTQMFSESICSATKCDFENGNTCHYKDAYQSQSIRGLTTKFEVVNGQFMNRVTGVKESIEGDYYAATFLFPREMAGLEANTEPFTENSRLRFQYYEGTHGVQLKGCCNSIETCPFSSDKFVKVSDRVWKTASFRCSKGTTKVIFLCENTRTNQGACAIDDLGMVESEGSLKDVRPLC